MRKKGKIKRVCASLRLKECERMSVSCEVIGAGFVQCYSSYTCML